MRQRQIVGNWKMHGTLKQSYEYVDSLLSKMSFNPNTQVMIAVPYTLLLSLSEKVKGQSALQIGAQNIHSEEQGAFTGEISASMLVDAGADFVIVGHSERRLLFFEDNAFIRKKTERALLAKLKVILCIGETLQERSAGLEKIVLEKQILEGIPKELPAEGELLLAYEPVWAIGTGQSATDEQAEEVHAFCREVVRKHWGDERAEKMFILYGGSVNAHNASAFLQKKNIDGALIGGASLHPESFLQIIQSSQDLSS